VFYDARILVIAGFSEKIAYFNICSLVYGKYMMLNENNTAKKNTRNVKSAQYAELKGKSVHKPMQPPLL
jgi:hypothetical protein